MVVRKVVYNDDHGGFWLSDKALELGREYSGVDDWGEWPSELDRHDPILVRVVEELGLDEASSPFSCLKITTVEGLYRIDTYDGMEEVIEQKDQVWF